MIILRPKNVIFKRFWPLSKFHFPACSTLDIYHKWQIITFPFSAENGISSERDSINPIEEEIEQTEK